MEFKGTEIAETLPQLVDKIDQYGAQASEVFQLLCKSEHNGMNGGHQIELAYKLTGLLQSMATLSSVLVERMTKGALLQLSDKLDAALGNPPKKGESGNDNFRINMAPVKE